MENFFEHSKNFVAIIVGAVIIGIFVYFGITNQPSASLRGAPPAGGATEQSNSSVLPMPVAQNTPKCGAQDNTIATKVIDGDTVVVEGGWHVRLLGMDADEKGYPCYDAAKSRLEELILDKNIRLEKDKTDVDQYGRCLRTIFMGNQNIDLQLVKEGLAVARFYEPDVKYRNEVTAAEAEAIKSKTGCKWQSK